MAKQIIANEFSFEQTEKLVENKQECPECHKMFVPYNNRNDVIFCSYECQQINVVAKKKETRRMVLEANKSSCPWCQQEFIPNRTNQAFCNSACRDSFKYRQRNNSECAEREQIKCAVCGIEFVPHGRGGKYCSIPCRQQAHAAKAEHRRQADPSKEHQYQREYRKRNNEAVRRHRLKNWYGISLEEYNALLVEQENKCAICKALLDNGKDTHLDHDHKGKCAVRGVLCSRCNKGLGYFLDSPEVLREAANYIEKHKKET